jgi:hypothetical protein
MDLREFQHDGLIRHHWETSRVKAIKQILVKYVDNEQRKVLDIG